MSQLPGHQDVQPPGWREAVDAASVEVQDATAAPGAAVRRPPHWGWLLPLVAAGFVLATASFALWLRLDGESPPSAEELDRGRRAMLGIVDEALEQHLRVHGEYPAKLDEALPLATDVEYHRLRQSYETRVRLSDGRVLEGHRP